MEMSMSENRMRDGRETDEAPSTEQVQHCLVTLVMKEADKPVKKDEPPAYKNSPWAESIFGKKTPPFINSGDKGFQLYPGPPKNIPVTPWIPRFFR
jgi:hypothetical protein